MKPPASADTQPSPASAARQSGQLSKAKAGRAATINRTNALAIPDSDRNHPTAAAAGNLTQIYMNASRWQGWFGESAGKVAVLYPACWCRTLVLLALMDSADPHLICRSSSRLESGSRFCGSRSDLFAITPCRALRKLSEVTSCAGSCPPSPTAVTPAGYRSSVGMPGHGSTKPRSCAPSCWRERQRRRSPAAARPSATPIPAAPCCW